MKQVIDYIISQLRGYYADEELRELAYWIVEECTGLTRTEILIGCKDTKKNVFKQDLEVILQKLRANEPIQYVFGHTEWLGLDLSLTGATLIPRPETAELVDWILSVLDVSRGLRVLDIGTGSGCIAIALKKHAPLWDVTGMDVSEEALAVAAGNGRKNGVAVHWVQADVLADNTIAERRWDVIVSNPPYICEKEKVDMQARVLDYEPGSALFVPDDDPLLFYRRIASLKAADMVFFEINEAYGEQVCAMLCAMGYTDVELKMDMYGKARMVVGRIAQ